MLNKLLQNKTTIFAVTVLVMLLAFIRGFERQLFYDPFLFYFEGDYMELPLPEFDNLKLFFGLSLRFFLNTILSLGILYFLFKDKGMILFASILYFFLFVILIVTLFCILYFFKNQENLLLFYVRRFLIQPLFLILFVPAFYYQNLKN
ncbi:exosortase F system-associated membrane protein [Flavobacterium granuli]|uniref:Exosortase F-associated protein n=1 Tax=Flavobacterium granuli TaxID=280093 RepID=A0ABU1RZ00_9FLAO|nr:exosortase F system-associated protein [Flavobacterium granuli]MDR6843998.1 exosortase F-associated protein [Flavobacterium granuli]